MLLSSPALKAESEHPPVAIGNCGNVEILPLRTDTPISNDYRSRILELISYSLGFYLEELIIWEAPRVKFRHPVEKQFGHLNEIVTHSLELYDHPAKDSFWGFSGRLERKLMGLQQMEGLAIDYKNTHAPAGEGAVGFNTLQHQVIALKESATAEVADFIDEHPDPISTSGTLINPVLGEDSLSREDLILRSLDRASKQDVALIIDSLFELDEVPHGFISRINARIQELSNNEPEPFRKNQPLDPIPNEIAPENIVDDSDLDLALIENPPKQRRRDRKSKGDIDFNARVLELLEENNRLIARYNDRFDAMQNQINDLQVEQQTATAASEARLQGQIDALYGMIENIGKSGSGAIAAGGESGLKTIDIVFEKNSHYLSLFQQTVLNEVKGMLLRNPNYRIMITGYADALGNREHNIILSRQRAQAVHDYLDQGGIAGDRLVVNYLGENKSQSANPLDRKVSIEWLPDYQP